VPALQEVEVLERVEISDDEDEEFEYNAVDEVGFGDDDDDDDDGEEQDLADALASLQMDKTVAAGGAAAGGEAAAGGGHNLRSVTVVRPSVVDDFIRNFLIKTNMRRALDTFNTEWYELESKGKLGEEYTKAVPDIYMRNQELDEQVVRLRAELAKMREITAKAQGTWDKFRKERDFHRMHHKRVVQEKGKLTVDLKRLRKHYEAFEPTLKDLQRKYEVAMKEKMLMRLERDRMRARVATLEVATTRRRNRTNPADRQRSNRDAWPVFVTAPPSLRDQNSRGIPRRPPFSNLVCAHSSRPLFQLNRPRCSS
jgi:hypothetical protein